MEMEGEDLQRRHQTSDIRRDGVGRSRPFSKYAVHANRVENEGQWKP